MSPDDKDAALLPHRINGLWALIHRPMTPLGCHIWISYSPDLRHWGGHRVMIEARKGAWWDANKIGLSSPPIETPKGWLVLYHGVKHTASGAIYRIGLALFDLQQPDLCLLRGDSWIFGPETDYERGGDVHDVVFPCGQTVGPDGDTVPVSRPAISQRPKILKQAKLVTDRAAGNRRLYQLNPEGFDSLREYFERSGARRCRRFAAKWKRTG